MNIQSIIVAVIVIMAVSFALFRLVRFFVKPEKSACTPEKCSACPYRGQGECSDSEHGEQEDR